MATQAQETALVQSWLDNLGKSTSSDTYKALLSGLADALRSGQVADMPSEVSDALATAATDITHEVAGTLPGWLQVTLQGFIETLFVVGWDLMFLSGGVLAGLEFAKTYATQEMAKSFGIELPPDEIILEGYRRGIYIEGDALDMLERKAYSTDIAQSLLSMSRELLGASELRELLNRGYISGVEFGQYMKMLGYGDTELTLVAQMAVNYYPVNEIINLNFRGILSDKDAEQWAALEGWAGDQYATLKSGAYILPPAVDLLVNARRGAFETAAIEKWGLHVAPPERMIEIMAMQGIDQEIAMQYWAGHWSPLPLPEAIQLFWRGEITEAGLAELYHLNGLAQGAGPLYTEARYMVPSYFVIEAMASAGALDEATTRKLVQWAGYHPEFVEVLVKSFLAKATSSQQSKTETSILDQFKQGALSKGEAEAALLAIGLSATQALAGLQQAELDLEIKTTEQQISAVEKNFTNRVIDQQEAVRQMIIIGLPTAQITYFIEQWKLIRDTTVKRLTVTEGKDAVKKGLMTKEQYLTLLASYGYSEQDQAILYGLAIA